MLILRINPHRKWVITLWVMGVGLFAGADGGRLMARETAPIAPGSPDDDAKPENKTEEVKKAQSIKEVMRFTMTKGLCQKVIKKSASAEEQKQLVDLFKAMAKMTPSIGDAESWKAKTSALVEAANEVAEGKPSHGALAKAANCAACHKDHRPK